MKAFFYVLLICFAILSCKQDKQTAIDPLEKIKFNLDSIHDNGLVIGAETNTFIYYQFCIPVSDEYSLEVFKVEPAIDLYPNQAGEVGCTTQQVLCMGHSHHNDWKTKLFNLAKLSYVGDIYKVNYGSN